MTPDQARSRAQRLVALALSANKNEARKAAVAACKLIEEHKLLETSAKVSLDDLVTKTQAASAAVRAAAADQNVRDFVSNLAGLAGAAAKMTKR